MIVNEPKLCLRLNEFNLMTTIRKRRLPFCGYIERIEPDRITKAPQHPGEYNKLFVNGIHKETILIW